MNSSILDDFHVVESPVSTCRLNLDEFSSASTPLQSAFCRQLTESEYEAIGESETDKQLKVLLNASFVNLNGINERKPMQVLVALSGKRYGVDGAGSG
jgi:hypothetical protein